MGENSTNAATSQAAGPSLGPDSHQNAPSEPRSDMMSALPAQLSSVSSSTLTGGPLVHLGNVNAQSVHLTEVPENSGLTDNAVRTQPTQLASLGQLRVASPSQSNANSVDDFQDVGSGAEPTQSRFALSSGPSNAVALSTSIVGMGGLGGFGLPSRQALENSPRHFQSSHQEVSPRFERDPCARLDRPFDGESRQPNPFDSRLAETLGSRPISGRDLHRLA